MHIEKCFHQLSIRTILMQTVITSYQRFVISYRYNGNMCDTGDISQTTCFSFDCNLSIIYIADNSSETINYPALLLCKLFYMKYHRSARYADHCQMRNAISDAVEDRCSRGSTYRSVSVIKAEPSLWKVSARRVPSAGSLCETHSSVSISQNRTRRSSELVASKYSDGWKHTWDT